MSNVEWSKVELVLRRELFASLQGLAMGTEQSLNKYAEAIAQSSIRAAEAGDDLSSQSNKRQIRALAHQHEIMARGVGWDVAERIILGVVRAGIGTVIAAIPSVPPI